LRVPRTRHERGRCDEATSGQETNKKALAIHVSGLLYERRAFRNAQVQRCGGCRPCLEPGASCSEESRRAKTKFFKFNF
jgi:hypothetical protein